jgi:hypothetical protein
MEEWQTGILDGNYAGMKMGEGLSVAVDVLRYVTAAAGFRNPPTVSVDPPLNSAGLDEAIRLIHQVDRYVKS